MTTYITSADIVYNLTIPGVFSTSQTLQGFAPEDIYSNDAIDPVELQMGADGILAAGWIPVLMPQRLMFQANSLSIAIFETWFTANQQARTPFAASATLLIPGTMMSYSHINGYLSRYMPTPPAKKALMPREFGITWQLIYPSPSAVGPGA